MLTETSCAQASIRACEKLKSERDIKERGTQQRKRAVDSFTCRVMNSQFTFLCDLLGVTITRNSAYVTAGVLIMQTDQARVLVISLSCLQEGTNKPRTKLFHDVDEHLARRREFLRGLRLLFSPIQRVCILFTEK